MQYSHLFTIVLALVRFAKPLPSPLIGLIVGIPITFGVDGRARFDSHKLSFSLAVFPNCGLEIIVASNSGKYEPTKEPLLGIEFPPLWGPGRLNSADGEC